MAHASTVGTPGIGSPLTSLRSIEVNLPPLPEQQAIACILGALDDKIELNRRRNRTLEAMARAIFRSWFVDFDPVRAKTAGRKPAGLSPHPAALFPDSFEDSALGSIPKGWRACRWGDIATLEYGKSLRDYAEADGPFRVFGTNGPIGWHAESLCDGPGVVIGRKATVKK
jgi:type I restriction enzyme S subunit